MLVHFFDVWFALTSGKVGRTGSPSTRRSFVQRRGQIQSSVNRPWLDDSRSTRWEHPMILTPSAIPLHSHHFQRFSEPGGSKQLCGTERIGWGIPPWFRRAVRVVLPCCLIYNSSSWQRGDAHVLLAVMTSSENIAFPLNREPTTHMHLCNNII